MRFHCHLSTFSVNGCQVSVADVAGVAPTAPNPAPKSSSCHQSRWPRSSEQAPLLQKQLQPPTGHTQQLLLHYFSDTNLKFHFFLANLKSDRSRAHTRIAWNLRAHQIIFLIFFFSTILEGTTNDQQLSRPRFSSATTETLNRPFLYPKLPFLLLWTPFCPPYAFFFTLHNFLYPFTFAFPCKLDISI